MGRTATPTISARRRSTSTTETPRYRGLCPIPSRWPSSHPSREAGIFMETTSQGVPHGNLPDLPAALLALNPYEARTAGAIFERMFPADENGPGAIEIGVVTYLDRALAG